MTRWFWRNERFAWPFVAAVVFSSLVLLFADFAWRVLVVPAETLAAAVLAVCIVIAVSFVGLHLLIRRRKRPS
jgi:hypothetical protein